MAEVRSVDLVCKRLNVEIDRSGRIHAVHGAVGTKSFWSIVTGYARCHAENIMVIVRSLRRLRGVGCRAKRGVIAKEWISAVRPDQAAVIERK